MTDATIPTRRGLLLAAAAALAAPSAPTGASPRRRKRVAQCARRVRRDACATVPAEAYEQCLALGRTCCQADPRPDSAEFLRCFRPN